MLNKIFPHIVAILFFFIVGTIYFLPEVQGERLQSTDVISGKQMNGEVYSFEKKTGEKYYWNNGMFGGMPWRLLIYGRDQNAIKNLASKATSLWQKRVPGAFFKLALTSYIALILLGVNPWLSMIGAFAYAYNTNFIVIQEAGHSSKVDIMSAFPFIVGGILLALKNKLKIGGLLFAVGCSLALYYNHIQMMYYLVTLLIIFFLVYIVVFVFNEKKKINSLFLPISILLVCAFVALSSGSLQLYSSKTFSEATMRGEPILNVDRPNQEAQSSSEVDGLEWGYVTQWSNNLSDVFTILVPRLVGGSGGEEVSVDSEMGRLMLNNGASRGSDNTVRAPMYWGGLPFTSGPYYLGALFLFIFVFSMFHVSPSLRWGIFIAFIVGLIISMGKNASWLVRPMYDYLPLFNKFRAHSSITTVLPALLIFPTFIGLSTSIDKGSSSKSLKAVIFSTGIVGGLCLILALLGPSLFDFLTAREASYSSQIQNIFIEERKRILRNDAFRSLFFVLAGAALLYLYFKDILKSKYVLFASLGVLMVIDLWGVDKRYIDQDNYVQIQNDQQNFIPRAVDQQIFNLEPKGRGYYRVLDLSIGTFSSASTSYHHNTIGGYSPAKLQRIEDLINIHISNNNQQVLNMLNTKYIIQRDQKLQRNPNALGNAWFVKDLILVNSPREEINQLSDINTGNSAVVLSSEFEEELSGFSAGDGQGTIELIDYKPNRLVYKSNTTSDQLAVFSEVWYGKNKGWSAKIDDSRVPIIRSNYLLRSLVVPSGEHTITFEFTPKTPAVLKWLTILSSWGLLLTFLGYSGYLIYVWINEPLPEKINKAKPARKAKSKSKKTKGKVKSQKPKRKK